MKVTIKVQKIDKWFSTSNNDYEIKPVSFNRVYIKIFDSESYYFTKESYGDSTNFHRFVERFEKWH